MKFIYLTFVIHFLLAPLVYSESTSVVCRLVHLKVPPKAASIMFVGPKDAIVRCEIPYEEISRPVRLECVDGKISFYENEAKAAPPVAVAQVPKGVKRALLLFLSSKKDGKVNNRVICVDYSGKEMPENGSIVFNASPNNLRFLLGEVKKEVRPGSITSVVRPERRNEFQMARVLFQSQLKKSWKTSYESMLRFPENKHRLFICYNDARTKQPSLRILQFNP